MYAWEAPLGASPTAGWRFCVGDAYMRPAPFVEKGGWFARTTAGGSRTAPTKANHRPAVFADGIFAAGTTLMVIPFSSRGQTRNGTHICVPYKIVATLTRRGGSSSGPMVVRAASSPIPQAGRMYAWEAPLGASPTGRVAVPPS